MSGHSKWANIKRKKEKTDAAKGKIFTKLGREIVVAVRAGGPNPDGNMRLAECIAKARSNNMPSDNIKRLIEKASGAGDGANYDEITYEGYGPGGVAFIVETMTDNKNRTAPEIRHAFDKAGGSLGASGCVAWMFERKGVIIIDNTDGKLDEDTVMMEALDAGAEDFSAEGGMFEITTAPAEFTNVNNALEAAGYAIVSADVEMIPSNTVAVDEDTADSIRRLAERLEENDDVQNVYHNAELPEEDEDED